MKKTAKRIISAILTVSMLFAMTATTFAKGTEAESYSTFITVDEVTGKEIEIKVPHYSNTSNYTLPTGASGFEGVKEVEIPAFQPFNYRDDWNPVSNVNNNPYNGIAQLTVRYANGKVGYGTGFVVGNGKVLTAAHNLYNTKDGKGGWVKNVVLTFLKNGASGTPQTITPSSMEVNAEWLNGSTDSWNAANDYGFIRVGTSGKMTFGLYSGAYNGTNYTISGYPYIRGHKYYTSTKMYTDTTKLEAPSVTLSGTVKHNTNICAGVSGAPMYGSNNYAVAIQTYGGSKLVNSDSGDIEFDGENKRGGFATLITQSVIDYVKYS